jgi:arsenate reductase
MKTVLFICIHNSARSQMAEAFLNRLGQGEYTAESAGLEPGNLNPYVVEVMKEIGYDISQNETKSVFDFYKAGKRYTYVVKVCDAMNGQRCPIFPGALNTLSWNLEDPSSASGSHEDKLERTRMIRDLVLAKVKAFLNDPLSSEQL